jgi:phospholipid/cholesterol/gamma-HCH transport system substrate-binding protein
MSLRPEPKHLPWMQLRVGIVSIAVLALLVLAVMRVNAAGSVFGRGAEFTVALRDGLGLREGSQVTIAGLPAGVVQSLDVARPTNGGQPSGVVARIRMRADRFAMLRKDSRSRVRALGLLGDRVLDFTPGSSAAPALRDTDTLAVESFAELGDLFSAADTAMRALTGVSADLRGVATQFKDGDGTFKRLLHDRTLYDSLLRTIRRADAVLARVETGQGTLGRLLRDSSLYGSVSRAAVSLDSAARLINDRSGVLAQLQRDTVFYRRLTRATAGVDTLMRGLNSGRGTAGQLLTERELYDRLLRVTAAFDSLAADVKRNPGRYTKGAVRLF